MQLTCEQCVHLFLSFNKQKSFDSKIFSESVGKRHWSRGL
jgi:hypothetical protein